MSNRDVGFVKSAESITIFRLNKTITFAVESLYKKRLQSFSRYRTRRISNKEQGISNHEVKHELKTPLTS